MKVRCFPSSPSWIDSFYIGNLVRGLQAEGVDFDLPADESGDFLSARWLRANAGVVDVLHFHWTHYHYTADTRSRSVSELGKFIGKLMLARRLGYRIVWTMHNYMPHERTYPQLHYLERFMFARLAHAVIVHCTHGRYLLQHKLLRRNRTYVVPLGDFGPYLSVLPSREDARQRIQIADECGTIIFFGMIRPYKQVSQLIQEFQSLDDHNLRLMIIGVTPFTELRNDIITLAATDSRISLRLEYVSDEELAIYLAAADVAVFPYRDILGSGSVMLALSCGLPVVAPKIGCPAELVTSDCGELYQPGPGAIAEALRRSMNRDLPQMKEAARVRARQFPWKNMVRATVGVYQAALEGSGNAKG